MMTRTCESLASASAMFSALVITVNELRRKPATHFAMACGRGPGIKDDGFAVANHACSRRADALLFVMAKPLFETDRQIGRR